MEQNETPVTGAAPESHAAPASVDATAADLPSSSAASPADGDTTNRNTADGSPAPSAPFKGVIPTGPVNFAPEEYPPSGRYTPCATMVLAPNPGPMSHTGTNTWILKEPGEDTCVIVDPGPDDQDHFTALVNFCLRLGATPVAVLLTHSHADHCQGAAPLAGMLGVPAYSRIQGNLPAGPLILPSFDLELEVVDLPGHSADCVGFLVPQDKALLTGDAIFSWGSTVIAPDGGNLADFFATLDTLEQLVEEGRVSLFLTGHGHVIDDPLRYVRNYRTHRTTRLQRIAKTVEDLDLQYILTDRDCAAMDASLRQVLEFRGTTSESLHDGSYEDMRAHLQEDPTIHRIFRKVYGNADPALEGPAKRNIQVQLQYLRDHGCPGN